MSREDGEPCTIIVATGGFTFALPLLIVLALNGTSAADDWPTYRHDSRRTGVTQETLGSATLRHAWAYRAPVSPRTAWGSPAKWDAYANIRGLRAMRTYDQAFHVTVVGTSFNLCPVLPCQLKGNTVGVFDEILIGTLADGSPINTRLAGFNLATLLFLEEGTQAPLTSACEQVLPRSVPALPLVGGALLALVLLLVVAGLAVRTRA